MTSAWWWICDRTWDAWGRCKATRFYRWCGDLYDRIQYIGT